MRCTRNRPPTVRAVGGKGKKKWVVQKADVACTRARGEGAEGGVAGRLTGGELDGLALEEALVAVDVADDLDGGIHERVLLHKISDGRGEAGGEASSREDGDLQGASSAWGRGMGRGKTCKVCGQNGGTMPECGICVCEEQGREGTMGTFLGADEPPLRRRVGMERLAEGVAMRALCAREPMRGEVDGGHKDFSARQQEEIVSTGGPTGQEWVRGLVEGCVRRFRLHATSGASPFGWKTG